MNCKASSKPASSKRSTLLALNLLVATLGPPAWAQDVAPSVQPVAPTPTSAMPVVAGQSFLSPGLYAKLRPAPDNRGVQRYFSDKPNIKAHTKVLFDPVQVIVTPGGDAKALSAEAVQRMAEAARQEFARALSPAYEVVNAPGPDVIRVRMAITNVQAVNPDRTLTDLVPIKAVFNLARKATGTAPQVAEISGEMEILAPSGEEVGAVMATRKSDKMLADRERITWDDLRVIAAAWAKNLRSGLDAMRSAPAPTP
jgi:hypothetical protein